MQELIVEFGLGQSIADALNQVKEGETLSPIVKVKDVGGAVGLRMFASAEAESDIGVVFQALRREAEAGAVAAAMVIYQTPDQSALCARIEALGAPPLVASSRLSFLNGEPRLTPAEMNVATAEIFTEENDAQAPPSDWIRVLEDPETTKHIDLDGEVQFAVEMLSSTGQLTPFAKGRLPSGDRQNLTFLSDDGGGDPVQFARAALAAAAREQGFDLTTLTFVEWPQRGRFGEIVPLVEARGFHGVAVTHAFEVKRRPSWLRRRMGRALGRENAPWAKGEIAVGDVRVQPLKSEVFPVGIGEAAS